MPPLTNQAPPPALSQTLELPAGSLSKWFAEEVQIHNGQLKAYVRRSFPTVRDVEDVVQESFFRIWKARARHPISATRAFLFQVARHIVLDQLRHNRISPIEAVADLASLPVADDRANAAECLAGNEKRQLLADAIAALPPRGRELMLLCRVHGLTHREAADQLGIAPKTVDEHISRGLKQLGAELRARGLETHF